MTPALARAALLPLVVTTSACDARQAPEANAPLPPAPPAPAAHTDRAPPALQRPQPLPKLARDVLDESMLEHGDHMETLLWASLMVDFETTRALADSMANAPRIARPPAGEDVLNAVFPPRFFELQDELYRAIAALGAAAAASSDADMATAYAHLASTCVTCHSIYLRTGLPSSPSGATSP